MRLAKILSDLISKNQGAFIKGRYILKNVLICQDIVKQYNRKSIVPKCLFKIDLQKAYDTVEWNFIEQMMTRMGFPESFINKVMVCVRSVTFYLCLNGTKFGYFKGQSGLRQGDPISPLLFTLCMEYLTRTINYATQNWPFQYHSQCSQMKLNHLMFADALLMFCKWNANSITLLMRAFSTFSKATGLSMNAGKSEVYFNGMAEDLKTDIKDVTGFQEGSMPFKYLGVPVKPTRLTKLECTSMVEKIVKRIRALGAKKLSYAGRLTLVNAVDGDSNSAFFHGLLKQRKHGNRVFRIEDTAGRVCDTSDQVQEAFLEYYKGLLGSSQAIGRIRRRIIGQGPKCSPEDCAVLMRPVSGKEVKDALFSIPDIKSPGPDGYTSKFFKDAWGEVVGGGGSDWSSSGFLFTEKIAQTNQCHNSYLDSKMLAAVLPHIVDQNQGAFIQNRSIQENILICKDLIRLYERPNASARCLFKIDLQKAYDTVEWQFVEELMRMLKFPADFQSMVMQCITTASFSLSLNGEMFGYFKGHRGLRQGDPLSPLIFTLCMEYLTRTLKYAAAKYEFHFHPMCKNQRLNCLMFADDVLLFSKGDTKSMMLLLQSFSTFSKASGLKVSPAKSNAYFRGVPEHIKTDILRISGFTEGALPFRYLGMPIQTTRLKISDCACLIEKICGRIHSYGARKFSYAGRLVLVKSVLNTLHSYWASMFILPKGIIRSIEAICRNYLWDNGTEYRRAPLVAWQKVCLPKEEGGLGLKNQEVWNKAMVGRLVNWIAENRDSIWVQWVQWNHIRGRDWFEYTPSTNSSWVWRRICKVKQEIAHGFVDGVWGVQPAGYTPNGYYEWLRTTRPPVCWNKVIWTKWALPKHQFMGWLVAHEALNTVDKLISYGMDVDDGCLLCGQTNESLTHLYFACQYSRRVLMFLQQHTGCSFPLVIDLDWWSSRGGTNVQRGVQIALFLGAIYSIWYQRNKCRLDAVLVHPNQIAFQVIEGVRNRTRGREKEIKNANDVNWLCHRHLM
ncbi:uncharacterized protein LOC141620099 [Silene latifolia]|uniref:uncharacterized protein LOC141620099 n=1 Tax=Silene latifolia TaxID=37657 RepID=UPI003D785B5D